MWLFALGLLRHRQRLSACVVRVRVRLREGSARTRTREAAGKRIRTWRLAPLSPKCGWASSAKDGTRYLSGTPHRCAVVHAPLSAELSCLFLFGQTAATMFCAFGCAPSLLCRSRGAALELSCFRPFVTLALAVVADAVGRECAVACAGLLPLFFVVVPTGPSTHISAIFSCYCWS